MHGDLGAGDRGALAVRGLRIYLVTSRYHCFPMHLVEEHAQEGFILSVILLLKDYWCSPCTSKLPCVLRTPARSSERHSQSLQIVSLYFTGSKWEDHYVRQISNGNEARVKRIQYPGESAMQKKSDDWLINVPWVIVIQLESASGWSLRNHCNVIDGSLTGMKRAWNN